jgi:hypothetical protein
MPGRRGWASASRASRRRPQPVAADLPRTRRSRQSRRLHPVHALPARLPRRAGQRRDRPGRAGRAGEDRVRHGRRDGRVELRGLRRMRAGLPDRRAGPASGAALAAPDHSVDSVCPYCGVGCQLTYHVKDDHIVRRRPRRPGQPGPAVREGPLRLRLRAPPAAPDRAADPPRRRPRTHIALRPTDWRATSARRAGTRRWRSPAGAEAHPRHARATGAGRLRLGQGQQRRGLPVPEAGAHWASARNNVDHCTRLCHASSAWRRCSRASARARVSEPGAGRAARRRHRRHRRQPDGEPPGGGDLDQERGASRARS